MPKINIPRAELEGPQLEPGTYPARVDKIKKRDSQAGNEVLNLIWSVMGTDPPAGSKVLDNITLVPDAYWKLNQLFQATKFVPGEDGFMTEELLGREAQIIVVEEEYNGVKRAKVNGYLPL